MLNTDISFMRNGKEVRYKAKIKDGVIVNGRPRKSFNDKHVMVYGYVPKKHYDAAKKAIDEVIKQFR